MGIIIEIMDQHEENKNEESKHSLMARSIPPFEHQY